MEYGSLVIIGSVKICNRDDRYVQKMEDVILYIVATKKPLFVFYGSIHLSCKTWVDFYQTTKTLL